ncbi:MAG: CocE/NonD family hydrolase [Solirubrobacteraceae bacterium]
MAARPVPLSTSSERAEETVVRSFDGVGLATDVYLPAPMPARPLPTILVRLPYDKGGEYAYMPAIAPYLIERGYAVVVQDVRGKGRSEGSTEAFGHEIADGHATLDWIESQRWSNGRVGMFGDSYYGVTQWAAAAADHRALKAVVPRFCSTRLADDWLTRQGVFCLFTMTEWAAMTWVDSRLWDFEFDWSHRPLCELIPAWLDGRRSASFDRWVEAIARSRPLDFGLARVADRLGVPGLHVGGSWDVFARGQVGDFTRASTAGRAPQHLLLRATDHYDDPIPVPGHPILDKMTEPLLRAAYLPRMLDEPLGFYDQFVAERGESWRRPVVSYEIAHGERQVSTTWPPTGATWRHWYLADATRAPHGPAGGALATRPERRPAILTWVHDPNDPVPTSIAYPWRPLLELPDERRVESRPDVMTFTSDPSRDGLDLAGFAALDVDLVEGAGGGHLMAKLVDVEPTGRSTLIGEGALRFGASPRSQLLSLDLGTFAYRVRPGHRLRVQLAGSSFPRYAVHPGNDDDPMLATAGVARQIGCRIGERSRLRVQALDR